MAKKQEKFDYKAELDWQMFEGCNKATMVRIIDSAPVKEIIVEVKCSMYDHRPPAMYVTANECPHNKRRRKINKKGRVGQGKGRSGGNL